MEWPHYVLTKRCDLRDVCKTRAMWGAECHTDHHLIRTTLNLHVCKPQAKSAPKPRRKLDLSKLSLVEECTNLQSSISRAITQSAAGMANTVNNHWDTFQKAVYSASAESFGHPSGQHADWFNANDDQIKVLLQTKHAAHLHYLAKASLQQQLRLMQDNRWNSKAAELQLLRQFLALGDWPIALFYREIDILSSQRTQMWSKKQ